MKNKELFIYVRRVSDDEIVLQKRWSIRAGMPDRNRLLDEAVFADQASPRNYRGRVPEQGRDRAEYYLDDLEFMEAYADRLGNIGDDLSPHALDGLPPAEVEAATRGWS